MSGLETLWSKGKHFLGVRIPIIAGAMTWISDSRFVSGIANAGAFGSLAAGNMEPSLLDAEIKKVQELTDKPFAVNLITIAPHYKEHLAIATKNSVPCIVFAGSFPRQPEVRIAKESGAKVMSFASTESIAQRLIDMGVDALILEGSEAGGHVGHVSLGILLQQVLFKFDEVPIFVAGGIATGTYIAHLLLMGAAGVQLGTFFVMTEECRAHSHFKQAFIRARARDAVATPQIGSELKVVAVRALRNKGLDAFAELQVDLLQKRRSGEISHADAQFKVEEFWVGALRRAVQDGDVDFGSLMAGQSVGLVDQVLPLEQALGRLLQEADAALDKIKAKCESI
ncbi:MAG: nitronate monooxygenase [Candidatus Aminicenantes bacterium]|nr:MAG: nitronate monooxygenase [Candidatus Aminicenantes bacterium]